MGRNSYLGGSTIIYPNSSWFGRGSYDPDGWEVTRVEEISRTVKREPVLTPKKQEGRSTLDNKSNSRDQQKAQAVSNERQPPNKARRVKNIKKPKNAPLLKQWSIDVHSIVDNEVRDQPELLVKRHKETALHPEAEKESIKKSREELLEEQWAIGLKMLAIPELPDRQELIAELRERSALRKARQKPKVKKSKEERLEKRYQFASDILFKK